MAVTHLARVGLDRVAGVLRGGFASWRNAGLPLASSGALGARQLERQLDRTTVLDVRDDAEFEEDGHIPGAHHLYVGYLPEHLERIEGALRERRDIAVTCSVGHRAGIAVSLREQRGITHVANLLGGMTAWQELELPTQKGRQQSITTPEIEGARK